MNQVAGTSGAVSKEPHETVQRRIAGNWFTMRCLARGPHTN